tara:strand:+ start:6433 stop:7155 length:723 start_codon:yes stop_codon:yes gene_type:complete
MPEYIIGMNAFLYTFNRGNLFRHNTNNQRNEYYNVPGSQAPSTITSVFNPEPTLSIKLFKTLSFESNAAWDCTTLTTDLSQGDVDEIHFEQKEGEWYAYVRHLEGVTNFSLRYANGLGAVSIPPTGPNTARVVTLGQPIGNIVSIGAVIYTLVGGNAPVIAGTITGINRNDNTITVNETIPAGPPAPVGPVNGDFILFTNNTVAESYGMRGYYMEFTLSNNDTTPVELFSVGSSVMKSFP